MKKITSLAVLAAAAAVAEDKISLQYLNYQEGDDRIKVSDWVLSAEINPDVDNQFLVNAGVDAITGASPALQSRGLIERPDGFSELNDISDSPVFGYASGGYEVSKVEVPDERRRSFGVSWLTRDKKRHEFSLGFDYSAEPDYVSKAFSTSYLWFADSTKNTSFNVGLSVQSNRSKVFNQYYESSWDSLRSHNLELGVGQVVSQRSVLNANVFLLRDNGYLSNHYQTILRQTDLNDDGVMETFLAADHRPDSRRASGTSVKWMMQWRPVYATHAGYRYYLDDWGIQSHTLDVKQYLDVTDKLVVSLLWRYYDQTAADFYRDPEGSNPAFRMTGFGSSDHRMGSYSARTLELGTAVKVMDDMTLNLQVGNYEHSTDFSAVWYAAGVTIKR